MPDSGKSPTLTLLCFDYGQRRIGVATGQTLTGTASALEVIVNEPAGGHFKRIEQLLHQWQPDALVIGVPVHEDGSSQAMTRHARRFGRQLTERFALPVHEADERLTSREAQGRFRQQRATGGARRAQAAREDAVAAQIILEGWFADSNT